MGFHGAHCGGLLLIVLVVNCCSLPRCSATGLAANQEATLLVSASESTGRTIPFTLFGMFFEVSATFSTYENAWNVRESC